MTASEFSINMPECCSEVLDSMYFVTVLDSTATDVLLPAEQPAYDFTLNFNGDLSGTFGLRVSSTDSVSIAANFLGEDEADISPTESEEVVGELANMLCGSIVSRIPSSAKFVLSHPLRAMSPPDVAQPHVLQLDTDHGIITTWVLLDESVSGE